MITHADANMPTSAVLLSSSNKLLKSKWKMLKMSNPAAMAISEYIKYFKI